MKQVFVYGGKIILNTIYIPLKLTAIVLTAIVDSIDTLRR